MFGHGHGAVNHRLDLALCVPLRQFTHHGRVGLGFVLGKGAPENAHNGCAFEQGQVEGQGRYRARSKSNHQVTPAPGNGSPDLAREVSALGDEAKAAGWPLNISAALVGSCTNSSYEDITRAASILRAAADQGLKVKVPLLITPGSEQVRATIERDGLLATFEAAGATVLANACGPCIGQWSRPESITSEANTIVTSYNRNFPKRNDGSANTLAFVTSPDTVVALALAGTVDFDPLSDVLVNDAGDEVTLQVPAGIELPPGGFDPGEDTFIAPPADTTGIEVKVSPTSDRLQLLAPFAAWDGQDFIDLPILLKAKGKCTTDHISMAGSTKLKASVMVMSGWSVFSFSSTSRTPLATSTSPAPRARTI